MAVVVCVLATFPFQSLDDGGNVREYVYNLLCVRTHTLSGFFPGLVRDRRGGPMSSVVVDLSSL